MSALNRAGEWWGLRVISHFELRKLSCWTLFPIALTWCSISCLRPRIPPQRHLIHLYACIQTTETSKPVKESLGSFFLPASFIPRIIHTKECKHTQRTACTVWLPLPGFRPWVRKIPWRREWLPTPVFLPGEFHGQRSQQATVDGITKSQTQLSD